MICPHCGGELSSIPLTGSDMGKILDMAAERAAGVAVTGDGFLLSESPFPQTQPHPLHDSHGDDGRLLEP